jgi:L-ribulose-5-phosphate 3-epimerase
MILNNIRLGIYEKAMPYEISWAEKLQAARGAGFDFIEISIDETENRLSRLDWSMDEKLKLFRQSREAAMPIYTMCLSGLRKYSLGSSDPQTECRSLEIVEKAIMFAADMGIRIIQLAGYDVYYEESTPETRARFVRNLKKCVRLAASQGVILALETMEIDFLNTVEKALHYIQMMDSPYLKIYPDTGNITNAAPDITKDILTGRGHIVAAHLKETKPGIFREVPFGQGHVDFVKAIRSYLELGVGLDLAEFWHLNGNDWRRELQKAYSFLKNNFILAMQQSEEAV